MNRLNNILVATDFSPASEKAIDYAALLAVENDAHLHVLHARVLFEDLYQEDRFPERERYQEALDRVAGASMEGVSPKFDAPVTKTIVRGISAPSLIVEYAQENNIDLIVVGTRGRTGLAHALLGSVAQMVVRLSPVSVLVVGQHHRHVLQRPPVRDILCPVDFSEPAKSAFATAMALANKHKAKLRALHVVEDIPHPAFYMADKPAVLDVFPRVREHAEAELKNLHGDAEHVSFEAIVAEGVAHKKIGEIAREHACDLIVMGSAGLKGLDALLLGSVTERVLRDSPCPVLVVKGRGLADV